MSSLEICERCGYPMRVKATDGINTFIECSNSECDNKYREGEIIYKVEVTDNVGGASD